MALSKVSKILEGTAQKFVENMRNTCEERRIEITYLKNVAMVHNETEAADKLQIRDLKRRNNVLSDEKDQLTNEKYQLTNEKDQLTNEKDRWTEERATVRAKVARLEEQVEHGLFWRGGVRIEQKKL